MRDRFLGILAPDFRASLSAMATACLRLRTFFPLRPDLSVPCLCSRITFAILPRPLLRLVLRLLRDLLPLLRDLVRLLCDVLRVLRERCELR